MPKFAPDGYAYYSVSTPSAFLERLLPVDEREWTAEDSEQWEFLAELADKHGTIVDQRAFQLG